MWTLVIITSIANLYVHAHHIDGFRLQSECEDAGSHIKKLDSNHTRIEFTCIRRNK